MNSKKAKRLRRADRAESERYEQARAEALAGGAITRAEWMARTLESVDVDALAAKPDAPLSREQYVALQQQMARGSRENVELMGQMLGVDMTMLVDAETGKTLTL